jgi:hypothetical protein
LTVAPSSFFHRLACRAATNLFLPQRKEFAYLACGKGITCPHNKKRNIPANLDARPTFLVNLEKLPVFDPSEEELSQILADVSSLNDDYADNSGTIHIPDGADVKEILARHPRCHVMLAIMRTEAIPLTQDTDNNPNARKLVKSLRRVGERIRKPSALGAAAKKQKTQQKGRRRNCQKCEWKEEGGTFEEHYTCVLQQVKYDATSRLIALTASDPAMGRNGSSRSFFFRPLYLETRCYGVSFTVHANTLCLYTFSPWCQVSDAYSGSPWSDHNCVSGSFSS